MFKDYLKSDKPELLFIAIPHEKGRRFNRTNFKIFLKDDDEYVTLSYNMQYVASSGYCNVITSERKKEFSLGPGDIASDYLVTNESRILQPAKLPIHGVSINYSGKSARGIGSTNLINDTTSIVIDKSFELISHAGLVDFVDHEDVKSVLNSFFKDAIKYEKHIFELAGESC